MCYYNQQLWLILTDYNCNYEYSHVVTELWLLLIVAVAMAVLFKGGGGNTDYMQGLLTWLTLADC